MADFTQHNHYVPQWHQKRFLLPGAAEKKLFYLDLAPEKIVRPDGKFHYRTACRRLGPVSCFAETNLYTLRFENLASDVIEKRFFGEIDRRGAEAVGFVANYTPAGAGEHLKAMAAYLDAQKLRTPKGLDFLKTLSRDGSHQNALYRMGGLSQMFVTMWMEGVWEILRCDQSPTKFILSDHPVTTYNRGLFPRAPACLYPLDAGIDLLGTHTLFPLDLNSCLVITNLGFVRSPNSSPTIQRENARSFGNTIFDVRKVQTGRHLREDQVRAVNYIMKMRAKRYVAAAEEEWLHPEDFIERKAWDKLGGKFFLMPDPRKVTFSTAFYVGYKDGSSWGMDEYGRMPTENDPRVMAQRARERETFEQFKEAWERHYGKLSREDINRYWT